MKTATRHRDKDRTLVEPRLAYHLRCLCEDATDPEMSSLERLALVRDRAVRMRVIEQELEVVGRVLGIER